jgi:hypothetical protein
MEMKIIIVLILTFIINIIGTLAYSTRVTGVITGKIAISFSIFNILSLISRTATSLQGPFLSKKVESSIKYGVHGDLIMVFRYILIASTLGCVFGAIIMPTFQKIFCKAVKSFDIYRSVPKLIFHGFSKSGISQFKKCIKVPTKHNITQIKDFEGMPKKVIFFNIIVTALSTTAVLSSLYAGVLNPTYRTTCSTLTSIVSSLATILLYLFIDPSLSIMTDDVISGNRSESSFKRCVAFMVSSRIVGTIAAQIVFIPGAIFIAHVASMIP